MITMAQPSRRRDFNLLHPPLPAGVLIAARGCQQKIVAPVRASTCPTSAVEYPRPAAAMGVEHHSGKNCARNGRFRRDERTGVRLRSTHVFVHQHVERNCTLQHQRQPRPARAHEPVPPTASFRKRAFAGTCSDRRTGAMGPSDDDCLGQCDRTGDGGSERERAADEHAEQVGMATEHPVRREAARVPERNRETQYGC